MRKWLMLFVVVVVMVLLWPLVHGLVLEGRICRQIRNLHGSDHGIIAIHVRGIPGDYPHIHMYRTLWEKSNLANFNFDDWGFGDVMFPRNHIILMVADAGKIHRYHWSFRQNTLVLEATTDQVEWRDLVDFKSVEVRNGLKFHRLRVPSNRLNWFFQSGPTGP